MPRPNHFFIGPLQVSPNLVLAPMSGITDSTFRQTIKEANPGAVGLVVSELISIEGLTRHGRNSLRMLEFNQAEQPLSIQLFGADPVRMAEAARMAADRGAAVIDINCGCPVPKVVKKGGGAELMRQPSRLAGMVAAIRKAVSVPVTVKLRSGWDEQTKNAVEVARMAESEGAAMVAVHGRTRAQLYRGVSDWRLIGEVKSALRIPVIGSGDIVSPEQALQKMKEFGVDGVMIGRGVLTNPWIFRQATELQAGKVPHSPDPTAALEFLATLVERLSTALIPRPALGRCRGLVCRMTRGLPHSAALRQAATQAPSVEALLTVLRSHQPPAQGHA